MRFLLLIYPGPSPEAGILPDPSHFAAMGRYNDELQRAGVLLALDGLHPSAKGARLVFQNRKATITDGPFSEAREVVGGYWLLQVKSKEEAVAWASRCPALDGEVIEVRQVFEGSEFPPEHQAAADGARPRTPRAAAK